MPLKDSFKWCPKAKKFKSEKGYVVKRKAKLNHVCRICGETIRVNEEYYQLRYYDLRITYPICESCWSGKPLSAKNKAIYQETEMFASEGRGENYW